MQCIKRGRLKVVYQSSTVGVLLADPTQAKVKVKFEGKAGGEPDDETSQSYDNEIEDKPGHPEIQREVYNSNFQVNTADRSKNKYPGVRDDIGKELSSLGYSAATPIDWLRVQLPKKQDLFQEFFRRIHNYMNTDTVIRIGDEEFHCHRIVLQIYSSFFDQNQMREIELPTVRFFLYNSQNLCSIVASVEDEAGRRKSTNVTPEAFQSVYEWMIFSGQESNKALKRDNILDLFCTAQYLAVKDLEEQCWSLIVNENLFTEDTAFSLFREARLKGMSPVMDMMVPRVMRFFLPLVASKDFLTLEPEEILTFLNSNYISVTSEIEVLMAGVRWLYGDWPKRRRYAVEVMRCVRFGLISPWQLVDIKRNPDNNEVLEIVNDPEVQQMVDDGLAYVIIKYWYGNNSKNYYHWIDVLCLTEPAERNWIGEEKNHVTYKDFLKYLEQFMVPREQMYQQMSMMQPTRRNDDIPGGMRSMDTTDKMELRRPKMEFPLPATLKGFTGDKEKSFPTMSEFFESRRKNQDCRQSSPPNQSPPNQSPPVEAVDQPPPEHRASHVFSELHQKQHEVQKRLLLPKPYMRRNNNQINLCIVEPENVLSTKQEVLDPPEKDSEDINTSTATSSTVESNEKDNINNYLKSKSSEKRHSVAASYLASATAALGGSRRTVPTALRLQAAASVSRVDAPQPSDAPQSSKVFSPPISLFNHSKESLAKINMLVIQAKGWKIMDPINQLP